jgi:hypothetical protein
MESSRNPYSRKVPWREGKGTREEKGTGYFSLGGRPRGRRVKQNSHVASALHCEGRSF